MISGDAYTGGAHPTPVLIPINYDLQKDTVLSLSDLFNGSAYLTKISQLCTTQLESDFGDSFIASGASAIAENFRIFNFYKTN